MPENVESDRLALGGDFARELLAWYDRLGVALPWRESRDPYRVWLSEIMLQQTQVETVKPYFERFLAAYPTVESLAAAPIEDVLKLWEGLGYYSRARNLHRAAGQIVARGGFPQTVAGLLELSGIGRYSAGAIASIAFGQRVPVVDGNVIRIFSRVCDLADDVTQPATQKRIWQIAGDALPEARVGQLQPSVDGLGTADLQAARALMRRLPGQRSLPRLSSAARRTSARSSPPKSRRRITT